MAMRSIRPSRAVSQETASARAALKKYDSALKKVRAAIAQCEDARGDLLAIYDIIMPPTGEEERSEVAEWRDIDKKSADAIVASLKHAAREMLHMGGPASAVGIYVSDD